MLALTFQNHCLSSHTKVFYQFLLVSYITQRRAKTVGKTQNTTDFHVNSNPLEDFYCFAHFQNWKSTYRVYKPLNRIFNHIQNDHQNGRYFNFSIDFIGLSSAIAHNIFVILSSLFGHCIESLIFSKFYDTARSQGSLLHCPPSSCIKSSYIHLLSSFTDPRIKAYLSIYPILSNVRDLKQRER